MLPVKRAAEITESPSQRWLVESLWTQQAVGILCAQPKSGKSWLALDFAVSVASGTPVLDRFAVPDTGPVLVFPAEDALPLVRDRLAGICKHRGVDFDTLDVWLIGSSVLRLDIPRDCEALEDTVAELSPRLLILDPLIRLHQADENSATEIAKILSFLRHVQRKYATAILLIHHARKHGGGDPGLGLRGSTEIRAWSDTNLFIRHRRGLELVVEHRAAPAPESVRLGLIADDEAAVHVAIEEAPPQNPDLRDRIVDLLGSTKGALSREVIRREVGTRNQTVGEILDVLLEEDRIEKTGAGYLLKNGTPPPSQGKPRPADTGALLGSNVVTTGR
jgi:hypothetical protein